jgi:NitT/TauT family transport system substrate-binding protein
VVQAGEIRVGVLKFGTVNWELDTIRHHGLARQEGVTLQVVPLASKSATQVAIQGGAVDVIVTDWIWVSRQRTEGRDYTFVPYSTAVGALMVDPKAGIGALAGLKGRRLGVAGGPLDKSWLLLRAYSKLTVGEDMARLAEPNFAAPPLLNELALRGELPAVLNYWHYGSSRQGCESWRVKVPLPSVARNGRLVYPLLGEVTN